jgi:hypothetical protein
VTRGTPRGTRRPPCPPRPVLRTNPVKFQYNYRDPDEQVEYKIRPATPKKPSAEQQRANDWDEWLLTDEEANQTSDT